MKYILLLFFCIRTVPLFSQNDFVLLKKNGYTIDRFYNGKPITVYTKNQNTYSGFVFFCRDDSIIIHLGYMGLKPTLFGNTIDSVFMGFVTIAVKDIAIIPAKRMTDADIGNLIFKAGFIIGGIAVVNQFNIPVPTIYLAQFASALAINFATQYIKPFKNKHPPGYTIGKKFTLEYIHLPPAK
ncbi:hypothetical protein [Hydrotalea sp.]|uniref:hypothetical protein n=1 Tax=Hydrotalea sp. TaxID=2881279 RepID=UPI0026085B66|nr:hypothetical protein [Hydrotalea sp.]